MRRISSQLTWTLIAVLASVAATNAQSKPAFEPPTVRYCDLISNPDAYDGKQIRLRAEYESAFEASVFADSKCVKRWDPKKLIWVEFGDVAFSKTRATTLKQFEDARYRPETDKDGRITSRWW